MTLCVWPPSRGRLTSSVWVTACAWVCVGTLLAASPSVAQQAPPPLETIHVAGNVYMLQTPTAGGNIGVFVGPDGVLLVDDQFSPIPDSIVAAVAAI